MAVIAFYCIDDHLCPEAQEIVRNVAGAAELEELALNLYNRNRGLRRDAVHLAPDVFIQHEIADNHDSF